MQRTPLRDRILPVYTKGEEIMNMVTHIVAASMGLIILIICLWISIQHHSAYSIAGSILFGLSVITLYTMSAIYHGLSPRLTAKKVFQIFDHCTIYVLIAGTYSPILLTSIRQVDPQAAWTLFGFVWCVSIIGIILNAIDLKSFEKLSMILYLALGWCIIVKAPLLIQAVPKACFYLILSGGLAYSIGVIFYILQKKIKYMHSIWHIFNIIGTLTHFLAIAIYCL